MVFVPASSLAIVGTVTVQDLIAESYLSTIVTNTGLAATDAQLKRVLSAVNDTALYTILADDRETAAVG